MKTILSNSKLLIIFALAVAFSKTSIYSQAPSKMSYQAVIRDATDKLVKSTSIGMKISILKDSENGTVVFSETQLVNTNANGLVSLIIGNGSLVTGDINAIDWGNGLYFIKTETDPTGGTNYTIAGTSQLLSVPYALYAAAGIGEQGPPGPQGIQGIPGTVGWGLTGNAGTTPDTEFIGTTDNKDVVFKRNKLRAGLLNSLNTSFGVSALNTTSSGKDNAAFGLESLFSNVSGGTNVAMGNYTLRSNTDGFSNTAVGNNSMNKNTLGTGNVAIGVSSLYTNTIGNYNIAIGSTALFNNTTAWGNVAIGHNTMNKNTTGEGNTALGDEALYSNTIGDYNVAIGDQALYLCKNGYWNVAVGFKTLYNNTNGVANTSVGRNSMELNTSGEYNTANGSYAMNSNTTGDYNTGIGGDAMYDNLTGNNNTAVGYQSLYDNISGDFNTALGYKAYQDGETYSNSSGIGFNAGVTASNQIRLGNSSISSIGGQVGWTTVSDKRFKKDIAETIPGLSFIMKLRPVSYHMDMNAIASALNTPDNLRLRESESLKENTLQSGFIAQEVEQAAKELSFDFSGVDKPKNEKDYYGLRYAEFVVPIVKAIQEQQQIITEEKEKNKVLQNKIESLEARLLKLEQGK